MVAKYSYARVSSLETCTVSGPGFMLACCMSAVIVRMLGGMCEQWRCGCALSVPSEIKALEGPPGPQQHTARDKW